MEQDITAFQWSLFILFTILFLEWDHQTDFQHFESIVIFKKFLSTSLHHLQVAFFASAKHVFFIVIQTVRNIEK